MRLFVFSFALAVGACNKSSTPPANPPAETPTQPTDGGETPPADAQRPGISAADCEGQGGKVVGDIGDGAVHRPDYRCESGQPPIGSITAAAGEPQATEGAVCCK